MVGTRYTNTVMWGMGRLFLMRTILPFIFNNRGYTEVDPAELRARSVD